MKYTTIFTVDARGSLRMFVTAERKKFSYSLGFHVDKTKWDASAQRCRRNTTHGKQFIPAIRINAAIQHHEEIVAEAANQASSADELKKYIDKLLGRAKDEEQKTDFFSLYETYIVEQSHISGWAKAVVYKHKRLIKEWKAFRPDIALTDINENTLNAFRDFQTALGHQNETTAKKISMSRWFFRWCISKGYMNNMEWTAYKPHLKKASRRVIFLTWDELMRVYNHTFEFPYLERVRDVFCFCCFTSLRYSDVLALKKTDIYKDALHITTQKTNTALTIELNDYSRAILDKYKDMDGEKALPVISSQKMNKYLKEVCRQCNIDEPITEITYNGNSKSTVTKPKWQMMGSHCGRRTFICNALMLGIAPNVIMKWTGHSDYKAMKPYIDIADEAKKSAMSLFNKTT